MPDATLHRDDRAERVAQLFRAHGRYVWRTLSYLGTPEREVADLVQDVFIIVHRKIDTFEDRSHISTWLYGICIRVAAAHRRQARVRLEQVTSQPPETTLEPAQAHEVERKQNLARLRAIVQTLPDDQREVFVMFEIEEIPMKEVAKILECPLQTVYSRLHRARDEVRRRFAQAELKQGEQHD